MNSKNININTTIIEALKAQFKLKHNEMTKCLSECLSCAELAPVFSESLKLIAQLDSAM